MNKVVLIGRLTKDPDHRQTSNGIDVTTFTVAVDRSRDKGKADFIPIVTWRELATVCAKYLQKGRQVAITGSMATRSYDANDGSKRYVTEVVADEVEFIGKRETNETALDTDAIDEKLPF